MSKFAKVLFVFVAVALVIALFPTIALADKPVKDDAPKSAEKSNNGQDKKAPASNEDKGQSKVSNGSGDKKAPNADNGKNTARPDQDGKGMDRGVVNDDKVWDGNNGCGNDKLDPNSPFEDDNNGKCKGLKKDEPDVPFVEPPAPPITNTPPITVTPPITTTPPTTPSNPPVRIEQPPSARVCFYSAGNAVEVAEIEALGFVSVDPVAFESSVFAEDWDVVCFDVEGGKSYVVLGWNARDGHEGPTYRLDVAENADGLIEFHNPIQGTVQQDWLTVTRITGRNAR